MAKREIADIQGKVQEQFLRLHEATDGYYAGRLEQALNAAVAIRVLVHETAQSRSLLGQIRRDYFSLEINDRAQPAPKAGETPILDLPVRLRVGAGGASYVRPDFGASFYRRVPLAQWWSNSFVLIQEGDGWLSKKDIILNVANKDGGAHVDPAVPMSHAHLSSAVQFMRWGFDGISRGKPIADSRIDLNAAYGIIAQSGCELQAYLEEHFGCIPR